MVSEQLTYENLIKRIGTWANGATDVRMVMIVGSRARIDHPHDEWSDLDVVVVTGDPEKYIRQTEWLDHFFRPLLTFLEPTAVGGYVERRVLFEGGLDVDFSIVPPGIFEMKWTPEVESVFHRGVKVLVDKDGLSDYLPSKRPTESKVLVPNDNEVMELVNEFFYQYMWCSKKLCRGELWSAKMCCDGVMKWQLLRMIEWHTHCNQSQPKDTWHKGRFFDRWVDESVMDEIKPAFPRYDLDGVWSSLFATKDLFKRLVLEVGKVLNYNLPLSNITSVEILVTSYYKTYQRNPK